MWRGGSLPGAWRSLRGFGFGSIRPSRLHLLASASRPPGARRNCGIEEGILSLPRTSRVRGVRSGRSHPGSDEHTDGGCPVAVVFSHRHGSAALVFATRSIAGNDLLGDRRVSA
jgi:hypothetical protein